MRLISSRFCSTSSYAQSKCPSQFFSVDFRYHPIRDGSIKRAKPTLIKNLLATDLGTEEMTCITSCATDDCAGTGELSKVIAAILAGNAYVNVHTNLSAGGEIRGQIKVLGEDDDDDDDD